MDGSFNQAAGHGQSAMSPQTPTGSSNYNVNMNRTKTRKWVEAKVQTYDGDDWGADEYDDDEESDPEPPVPKLPTSQRLPSASQTLPSQAGGPSGPALSGPSDPSSLRLQTQPPPPAMSAPASQPRQAGVTSPVVSDPSSVGSPSERVASDQLVSPQSIGATRDHDAPPLNIGSQLVSTDSADEPVAKPLPFVRPSDIYRRMEEEKDKERRSSEASRPNMDTVAGASSDRSASPSKRSVEQPRRGSDKDDASDHSFQSHSNLDTIPERKSEYGMDQLTSKPQGYNTSVGPIPKTPTGQGEGQTQSGSSGQTERASTSPKLPDVARMSAFGMDFFSPATNESNDVSTSPANPQREHSELEEKATHDQKPLDLSADQQSILAPRPSNEGTHQHDLEPVEAGETGQSPQGTVAAGEDIEHSTELKRPTPGDLDIETTNQDEGTSHANQAAVGEEQARMLQQSVAPLRTSGTPSPVVDSQKEPQQEPESRSPGTHIAPTEPLQPRRLDSPPVDFEPRPIERGTTFDTVTSSPMKESDVLSDEIMRSLSPGGLAAADAKSGDEKQSAPGGRNVIRESSYTLRDYDSYWADTTEKETGDKAAPPVSMEPVPPLPPIDVENTKAAPVEPFTSPNRASGEAATSARPDVRRRFSWEAADDAANPTTSPVPAEGSPVGTRSPGASEPPISIPSHGPGNESSGLAPSTARGQELSPISIPISHQVSKASTARPVQERSSLPEPPSPVSVTSDKEDITAREVSRLSLTDGKANTQGGSAFVSPSGPLDGHPALATSPSTSMADRQAPSLSNRAPPPAFRDIMGMPTPAERIAKYNQASGVFASTDSGLDNWMASLMTQDADHAGVASSHVGSSQPPNQGGSGASPSGSRAPAQQPYYQQYLNASSPGGGTSPSGRSRLGGLPISTQAAGSTFGHSGNQIGTKGKEFMQSAGKMGKGLLSKGKSKLRGSGDKGESNPPPVQQNLKNERRTSWGLSLGARSRTDGPALHSSETLDSAQTPTPIPQLPQPARMSPFDPVSRGDHEQASQWAAPRDDQNQDRHADASPPEDRDEALTQPGFFAQTEERQQGSGRFTLPPTLLTKSERQAPSQQPDATQVPSERTYGIQPTGGANPAGDDHSSDDWVVVPRTVDDSVRGPAAGPMAPISQKAPAPIAAEDSGVAMQSKGQHGAEAVKRDPSFIGLPPIRRGSTFGLTSRARRATERFSLDDEDEVPMPEAPLTEKGLAIQNSPSTPRDAALQALDNGSSPAQGRDGHMGRLPTVQQSPPQDPRHVQNTQPRFAEQNQRGTISGSPEIQPVFPKSSPMLVNAMQRMPPSGPWKLEESHLSEPLHSVTRNRPDTGGSPQQVLYGYDKETGMSSAAAPALTQSALPRPKNSDVPPSSAQRYPELFSPRPEQDGQGRPRVNSRTSSHPHPQQYPGPISREDALFPRTQGSEYEIPGVGPPEEDRGRKKRNSGIFKDIGNRIARATSRERRSSLADTRPVSGDLRGDEASESSVLTEDFRERKKRRSSFLFSLPGRPSMDQKGGERPPSALAQSESQINEPTSTTPPQSQGERKRSFFGAATSGISAVQHKFKPGGLTRSSTSSLVNESRSGIDNIETGAPAPQRKRFSDIAKVPSFTNIFRPGQQERKSQAPQPDMGSRSSLSMQDPGSMGPPEAPFQSISRSGTGGSVDLAPPGPLTDRPGRRNRRGSVSEIFSGILGRKSESGVRGQQSMDTDRVSTEQQQHTMHHANENTPRGRSLSGPQDHMATGAFSQPDTTPATVQNDSHNPTTIKRVSQASEQQPRPSPLGAESPMTHGPSPVLESNPEPHQTPTPGAVLNPATVDEEDVKKSLPGTTTNMVKSPLRQPSDGVFDGVGAQNDVAKEDEISRSITVSPDLSVVSGGDTDEAQLALSRHKEERAFTESSDILVRSNVVADNKNVANKAQRQLPPSAHLQDAQRDAPLGTATGTRQAEHSMSSDAGPRRISGTPTALTDSQAHNAQAHVATTSPPAATSHQVSFPSPRNGPLGGNRTSSGQVQGQQFGAAAGPPHFNQQGPHPRDQRPTGPQPLDVPSNTTQTQAPLQAPTGAPWAQSHGNSGLNVPGGVQTKISAPNGPTEGQGQRWKALKTRVTGQMAQMTTQNQDKPEKGDRLTSGKIREVFKRGPRQTGPQPTQQTSPQPTQQTSSNQLAQQWQRSSLPAWQPPFQEQTSPYGQQPQQPPQGFPSSQPRRVSAATQQPPISAPPRQWQQGEPPGASPANMGQGLGLRQPEPQYDQVPIPQGYTAVHGDATVVPSTYNVGRRVSQEQFYHPQQPCMPPGGYAQPQYNQQHQFQPQHQHPHPHPHPHPHQQHQQHQQLSQHQYQYPQNHHQPAVGPLPYGQQPGYNYGSTGDRRVSDVPSHASGAPWQRGVSALASPVSRLDDDSVRSSQVGSSSALTEKGHGAVPQDEMDENPGSQVSARAASKVPQPGEYAAKTRSSVDDVAETREVSRPSSLSPQMTAESNNGQSHGQKGNRRPSQLGLDVQKARTEDIDDDLYAATPRVTKDETGESSAPSQISRMTSGETQPGADAAAKATKETSNDDRAELEDTEGIRVRTMRLEAQEEKILYHPDEDNDGPQMSATSYPGQEWNPYGVPEFGDWRDD